MLQRLLTEEARCWSDAYEADESPDGFRSRIDAYAIARADFMERADQLTQPEFERVGMQLGTRLAIAFGFIEPSGEWRTDVLEKVRRGGARYADSSIRANFYQQLPGLARSALMLTTGLVAAGMGGSIGTFAVARYAAMTINAAYVVAQTATLRYVPFLQAAGQSRDVAARSHQGPDFQPAVIASQRRLEDGTVGPLVGLHAIDRRIRDLETLRGQIEKTDSSSALIAKVLELADRGRQERAELARICDAFTYEFDRTDSRRHEMSQRQATRVLETHAELTFYASLGPIELPENRSTLPARSFRFTMERVALPRACIVRENIAQAIARWKTQRAIESVFAHLGHQAHQGGSRNVRNLFNIGTAAFGLLGTALDLIDPAGYPSLVFQASGLASQSMQVLGYHLLHGSAAASDYESLLATQFQVTALTGLGNIAPHGKVDPKRLNTLLVGPLRRRITHFRNVLEFDRLVYLAAMLTHLADKAGNMPRGSYQESVAWFRRCTTPEDREMYVRMYLPQPAGSPQSGEAPRHAALAVLELYEANERNIELLASNHVAALLSDESSTLPPASRQVLRGALLHAAGAGASAEDEGGGPAGDARGELSGRPLDPAACDETLVRWKGLTESLSDLPSAAQAAQKIGQTFSLFVAGPAAPLAIKLVASAAQAVVYGMGGAIDEPTRKAINAAITLGGGSISTVGSVVAMFVVLSYHINIKTKEAQRQRNEARGASIANAGVGGSLKQLSASQSKPGSFDTLAAASIPAENRPDIIPFDATLTFWNDVLEQIRAPSFAEFRSYLGIEPAVFDIGSPEEADRLIQHHTRRLLGRDAASNHGAPLSEVVVQGSPRGSGSLVSESDPYDSSGSSSEKNARGPDLGPANALHWAQDTVDDSMVDRNEDSRRAAVYDQLCIEAVLDQLGIDTSRWECFVGSASALVWLNLGNLIRWMSLPDRQPAGLDRWSPQLRNACRQLAQRVSNDETAAFKKAERSAFRSVAKRLRDLESEAPKGDLRSEASV